MADQLLSIEDSALTAIANAIRNKGGTSAALSFPNGFVSALQAIETEATVTPKITPQQVTLTPSNTSFPIEAGFHDGTGTVKIETETGSANPTSTEQTYYPSAGKFFSSFYVGGIGSGKKVITGTKVGDGSYKLTITQSDNADFDFKPSGMAGMLINPSGVSGDRTAAFQSFSSQSPRIYWNLTAYSKKFWNGMASSSQRFDLGTVGVATANFPFSMYNFKGTYFYVIWG